MKFIEMVIPSMLREIGGAFKVKVLVNNQFYKNFEGFEPSELFSIRDSVKYKKF